MGWDKMNIHLLIHNAIFMTSYDIPAKNPGKFPPQRGSLVKFRGEKGWVFDNFDVNNWDIRSLEIVMRQISGVLIEVRKKLRYPLFN